MHEGGQAVNFDGSKYKAGEDREILRQMLVCLHAGTPIQFVMAIGFIGGLLASFVGPVWSFVVSVSVFTVGAVLVTIYARRQADWQIAEMTKGGE